MIHTCNTPVSAGYMTKFISVRDPMLLAEINLSATRNIEEATRFNG